MFNSKLQKKQLIYIGGKSASAITQRILNHLIENSVACKISLTGKGKKAEQGIKDTPVHHLLFRKLNLMYNNEEEPSKSIYKSVIRI